jgi:protein subunit release factor A
MDNIQDYINFLLENRIKDVNKVVDINRIYPDSLSVKGVLYSSKSFIKIIPGSGGQDAESIVLLIEKWYLELAKENIYDLMKVNDYWKISNKDFERFHYNEVGIHRIIRNAPHSGKRQTSFVSVALWLDSKFLESIIDGIELEESDIVHEAFGASTKGGQNANKTATNVRMKYSPFNLQAQVKGRNASQNYTLCIVEINYKVRQFIKSYFLTLAGCEKLTTIGKGGEYVRSYYIENDRLSRVLDHKTGKVILCKNLMQLYKSTP